ncbi:MAG: hypothetical protein K0R51_2049 [Cytophagaceae bacterium]|jgi:hypothetical protein|nr:hypothetical protein [Cytophagaceae bacterium]
MKKLVSLLFLFLFLGSSFTHHSWNGNQPLELSTQPLMLDVKIEHPQSASSNDGVLFLNVSGGTAPYTIQVISTFSPSQVYKSERVELKNLGVGNYTIMVQDAEKHVLQKIIELTPMQ